jgi:hypothetical protein
MKDWNDGMMEKFDNSTIRQLEKWNDGMVEWWNGGRMS